MKIALCKARSFPPGKRQDGFKPLPNEVAYDLVAEVEMDPTFPGVLEWRGKFFVRTFEKYNDLHMYKESSKETVADPAWVVQAGTKQDLVDGLASVMSDPQKSEAVLLALETDNPCATALDDLWRDIILAKKPNYGDWEYPGMAYRHLKAEFDDRDEKIALLEAELAALRRKG